MHPTPNCSAFFKRPDHGRRTALPRCAVRWPPAFHRPSLPAMRPLPAVPARLPPCVCAACVRILAACISLARAHAAGDGRRRRARVAVHAQPVQRPGLAGRVLRRAGAGAGACVVWAVAVRMRAFPGAGAGAGARGRCSAVCHTMLLRYAHAAQRCAVMLYSRVLEAGGGGTPPTRPWVWGPEAPGVRKDRAAVTAGRSCGVSGISLLPLQSFLAACMAHPLRSPRSLHMHTAPLFPIPSPRSHPTPSRC